jgi:membrane protein
MQNIRELAARFRHAVFEKDLAEHSRLGRTGVYLIRLFYGIGRKFADGQLNLWATSLVYTTLLSLVPLIAVSFSVLKAFGVQNQLQPALLKFLTPLGEQAVEVSNNIVEFVNNTQVGVLGALGIALLFYTVISLLQKIEEAFNAIWQVPGTRGLARRFRALPYLPW